MLRRRNKISLALLVISAAIVLIFVNCSRFGTQPLGETLDPIASQTQASKKTNLFLGGTGVIQKFSFDHQTDQITRIPNTTFDGREVGWMSYDPVAQRIWAADADTNQIITYGYSPADAGLVVQSKLTGLNQTVHTGLLKSGTSDLLFESSYGGGQFSLMELDSTNSFIERSHQTYSSTAKTHSSAIDAERSLVFVSNLGENKIYVYKLNPDKSLTEYTQISIPSPRMVVFDSVFKLLYVVTESYSNTGFMKIYRLTEQTNSAIATEVGSYTTPLIGADLKVVHATGYVAITVREVGQEAIHLIPITKEGLIDSGRQVQILPLGTAQPRSLAVSSDGRYYFVAFNAAGNNLTIYKLEFDSQQNVTSQNKIYDMPTGSVNYLSLLSIEE